MSVCGAGRMGRGARIVFRSSRSVWRAGRRSVDGSGAGLEAVEEPQRCRHEAPLEAGCLELAGEYANHLTVGRIDLGRLGKIAQAKSRVHGQHKLLQYEAGLHAKDGRAQNLSRGRGDHLGKALRPAVNTGAVDVGIVDAENVMLE